MTSKEPKLSSRAHGTKQSVVFVAEVDGDLVGFTQLYPLFSSTNMAKLWLLNDLYVQPKIRGKAIGKALLKAAQDHCVATQAKGLSLEQKTNQIGNGLYPKMDFVCDDEHNFYYWENPSYHRDINHTVFPFSPNFLMAAASFNTSIRSISSGAMFLKS